MSSDKAIACQLEAIVDLACSREDDFDLHLVERDMRAAHDRLLREIVRRRTARAARQKCSAHMVAAGILHLQGRPDDGGAA